MQIGMIITGGICLVYYIILLAVKMDFSLIWLAAGVVLLLIGKWGHLLAAWIKVSLLVVFLAGLAVFIITEFFIIKTMLAQEPVNPKYLIVLGAQVKGETPSRALRKRLEKAEIFLKKNPKTIAILSGGQGAGEDITEAQAMYIYLIEAGIDAKRLILEDESTSTLENLSFSGKKIEDLSESTAILSNNFHIYRALLLARKLGYTQVAGVAADSDPIFQVHYLVREFFALIKEKSVGNI